MGKFIEPFVPDEIQSVVCDRLIDITPRFAFSSDGVVEKIIDRLVEGKLVLIVITPDDKLHSYTLESKMICKAVDQLVDRFGN